MVVCFKGLHVIGSSIFAKGKNVARVVLHSEDADIITTLPFKHDKNIFNPNTLESYSVRLSSESCYYEKGVLFRLVVSSFAVDDDALEDQTRIIISLTDEVGDYKNGNSSYSEIEFNWFEKSEKGKELNLELGKTLYVLIQPED